MNSRFWLHSVSPVCIERNQSATDAPKCAARRVSLHCMGRRVVFYRLKLRPNCRAALRRQRFGHDVFRGRVAALELRAGDLEGRMRARVVIAILLFGIGFVWVGQGIGLIGGSFMTGEAV